MDAETLYKMAKAASRGAERAIRSPVGGKNPDWMQFGGYPAYVNAYNRLLPHVWQLYGDEAKQLFRELELGKQLNPAGAIGAMWKTYLEMAGERLDALAAYLETKVPATDRQVESLIDLLALRLRASLFRKPESERDVQDAVEVLLSARDVDHQREVVAIEYSSKKFIPDFTLESHDLALEVKFCASPERERGIVDEINADIPAYRTRYSRALFLVFDIGAIRDVAGFKKDIESNPDIHVVVLKW